MDKVIVTALLTIGAVAAALVFISSIGPSISTSSSAVMESTQEGANRIKTSVEIIAVTSNAAGTQIDAWVKNVGLGHITPVDKSDVFVIKPADPGKRFDAMTYDTGGGDKTWDTLPSGIATWNRGDTLHIVVDLSVTTLAGGDHVLRVATNNGIISDIIFSK